MSKTMIARIAEWEALPVLYKPTHPNWRKLQEVVYQMQIKDKACTICVYVWARGRRKICGECEVSGTRKNWKLGD